MNDYKIKELYEQMELEIIDSMKRNLSRHLLEEEKTGFKYTQWQAEKLKELKRYQRENKTILNSYIKGLDKEISNHLKEEFKQSFNKQLISYTLLGINKENKNLNKTFFKINDRKVNSLIKVVNNDLNKANRAVLRMVNDEYRQIIHKSAFFVANGVKTEEQTTKMAIEEINEKKLTMNAIDKVSESFLNGGINCIEYADGKRVNIASYAQMAVRTANQRAQLMGEGEFRKSINQPFVIVSKHNHTCKLCQPWQGKVLIDDVYSGGSKKDGKYPLLSEAMKKGLFHPNCRHGLPTYYPELEGISYDEIEDNSHEDDHSLNKEKKLYYERQIKRFERLEKGSISPLNIQQFAERKEDWINKKEELLIDKKPINELSKDSKDALQYYVQGNGMYINDYLRNRNNHIERMGEMTDFDNQLIKDLDNATDNIISDKKYYYEDITEKILKRKTIKNIKERRLLCSYDKNFNKYKNFYFDSNKKMKEELDYQLTLEDKIKFKVYLNPKTHTKKVKTPDYLIPELKGLYDLKKLNGDSPNLIDNIFHKYSKQTYNLILRKNKTHYTTEEIMKQIKDIYENNKRIGIKNVIFLDENDNLVLFYKR